jgi:hypothetical protein
MDTATSAQLYKSVMEVEYLELLLFFILTTSSYSRSGAVAHLKTVLSLYPVTCENWLITHHLIIPLFSKRLLEVADAQHVTDCV